MLLKRFSPPSLSLLMTNMSWLLSVEGAAKLARFVTIFTMAAFLSPSDYGLVILCLAIHDIFRLLMRAGSGTQVIQCEQDKLTSYAKNAASIQWLLCLGLALIQFTTAPLFADFYQKPEATELLQWMALSYLFYPAVSVRVYLLQRAHRFKEFSLVNGTCIVSENLLIAVLLWFDFGIFAVAYAKVFAAVLWFVLFMRAKVTNFGIGFQPAIIRLLVKTSGVLMLAELSKAAKQHADVFVAGRVLSPELFGLYTFAKTASLGMSQSFINAYQGALLPYLSEQNRAGEKGNHKQVVLLGLALSFTFVIQAVAAQWYVPILFGDNWLAAVIPCSILCLCAIPTLWLDTFCCSLRAKAQYKVELFIRMGSLTLFATTLMLLELQSAVSFAIFTTVMSIAFTAVTLLSYRLFPSRLPTTNFNVTRSKS